MIMAAATLGAAPMTSRLRFGMKERDDRRISVRCNLNLPNLEGGGTACKMCLCRSCRVGTVESA